MDAFGAARCGHDVFLESGVADARDPGETEPRRELVHLVVHDGRNGIAARNASHAESGGWRDERRHERDAELVGIRRDEL